MGPATLSARCRCGRCGQWLAVQKRLRVPPGHDWLDLHCETCDEDTRSSYQLSAIPLPVGALDQCFGLPLWLQTTCGAQTLFAFNPRHLAFLRDYVSADLRERGPSTASAASRLPGWLKRAERPVVLRSIARLEQRLLSGGRGAK